MPSRILALATATVAVVLTFVGCGDGEPQFDPATRYSPESLAKEFSFLYKSLDKTASGVVPEKPDGLASKGGALSKGADATKAAQATTLDGVLKDTIQKAASIPGMNHSQACKKVAEEIAKDPGITDADKKIITEKLEKVPG